MARGQPTKKPQPTLNISGLCNQSGQSSPFSESTPTLLHPDFKPQAPMVMNLTWRINLLKTNLAHEEACPDEGEEEEEELEKWEGFSKEDLAEAMVAMCEVDDPFDLDWLPERLKNKRNKRKKEKKGMYSQSFCLFHYW